MAEYLFFGCEIYNITVSERRIAELLSVKSYFTSNISPYLEERDFTSIRRDLWIGGGAKIHPHMLKKVKSLFKS